MLVVETFTDTLERAVQKGMLLELLQEMRELKLGEVGDMFGQGLTGETPALVALVQPALPRSSHESSRQRKVSGWHSRRLCWNARA